MMMMSLISLLQRPRPQAAGWPLLDGFSEGAALRLPPGELIAEDGVLRLEGAAEQVMAKHDEAWIALKLDAGTGWYAIWCPYDQRWEVLSFDLEHSMVQTGRPGLVRRRRARG
jgi:hypothetical protein